MKRYISETSVTEKTPDLKYYAFDWDDNIVHMPTKIILRNDEGDEVGMSTEDFAEYRSIIGKENFDYKGETIVGYSDEPFKNFRTQGDKQFLVDVMNAKKGPAFDDFKECINNGSIFSIITARGHHPNTIKQAVYNYIVNDWGGISKKELLKNLRKYRNFTGDVDMSDNDLIKFYLDLNKFYPVSYFSENAETSPEDLKVMAMQEFIDYIKEMAAVINKRAWLKNDVSNNFIPSKPSIGFSDDDVKNVMTMNKNFKDKKEANIITYSTAGGSKKEVK
jgi:hypothetical protein